jgi:hypothetical protein
MLALTKDITWLRLIFFLYTYSISEYSFMHSQKANPDIMTRKKMSDKLAVELWI